MHRKRRRKEETEHGNHKCDVFVALLLTAFADSLIFCELARPRLNQASCLLLVFRRPVYYLVRVACIEKERSIIGVSWIISKGGFEGFHFCVVYVFKGKESKPDEQQRPHIRPIPFFILAFDVSLLWALPANSQWKFQMTRWFLIHSALPAVYVYFALCPANPFYKLVKISLMECLIFVTLNGIVARPPVVDCLSLSLALISLPCESFLQNCQDLSDGMFDFGDSHFSEVVARLYFSLSCLSSLETKLCKLVSFLTNKLSW